MDFVSLTATTTATAATTTPITIGFGGPIQGDGSRCRPGRHTTQCLTHIGDTQHGYKIYFRKLYGHHFQCDTNIHHHIRKQSPSFDIFGEYPGRDGGKGQCRYHPGGIS